MSAHKTCMLCEKPLLGRTDKKYCSDFCRNTYNNKVNRQSKLAMQTAQSILSRNRRILREVLGESKITQIHTSVLLSKGYHFDYLTCIRKSKRGEEHKYCYEFNIREITPDVIEIIQ